MIDWSFPPDLQAKYDRVLAQTRKLQAEFGIKPMTIEERYQNYLKRQEEITRREQEIKEFEQRINRSRPVPKWKV
jgi:peptidoglycan hydrolase CwlO-like protein